MKLIVAVFEGADFDILSHLMGLNLIPNFKKLDSFNKCKCSLIPYEAAGLMSVFSGIAEADHGISSYWKSQNSEYIPELWNSNDVKDCMIWNSVKNKNIRTAVINLWGTHPVYPMNGHILSYSMEKSLRFCYPSNLSNELIKNGYKYVQDTCAIHNESTVKEIFCNDVLKIDMLRHNCIEFFENICDVIIVNYTAIDRISHFYFDEYQKEYTSSQLYRAYKQCDYILSDLMNLADRHHASLIVLSEIGFGRLKKFVKINKELYNGGFLKYKSNGVIDWEQTVAFESVQGSHGININRKGRNIYGTVNDNDYASMIRTIIDFLNQLKNPDTGKPYFKSVMPGCEYYNDCNHVPDIVLEPFDEEYLPYGDPYWSDFLNRDLQTGWHRSNGFYAGLSKYKLPEKDLRVDELYETIKNHF